MVLLVAPSPSSCSSASSRTRMYTSSLAIPSLKNTTEDCLLAQPVSDSSTLLASRRQVPLQEYYRSDELMESESDDDDCSDSSSISSDSSSNFDTSSTCSSLYESESLDERRRAMLDLSISKIQTMNTSNVAVSLRKSLLIFNTMKLLQRDLASSGMEVYDSLTERENGVTNDNAVLEDVEEGGDWEQLNESQQTVFDRSFGAEDSVWGERVSNNYLWPWGITDFSRSYSDDKMQGWDNCGRNYAWPFCVSEVSPTWDDNNKVQEVYSDDYLRVWGDWDDDNYNPLNNCNLTDAEITNMFHFSTRHLGSEVASQA